MHKTPLLACAWLAALSACATAPAQTTQPKTQPSTQPATQTAPNPAHQWLERIEQRAAQIKTLRADIRYDRVQGLLGDRQIRFGKVFYDAGPPTRFAIQFERIVMNNRMRQRKRWYVFDGRWLAELQFDQNPKVFIRRELVPAGEEGQQMLELGEGPFPLPLDLEKAQVLARFEVDLRPVEDNAPPRMAEDGALKNTVHLRLTPRPRADVKQEQIDVWYDRQTRLPVVVRAEEKGQDHLTARLTNTATDVDIPDATFDTSPPDEPGWQVQTEELDR